VTEHQYTTSAARYDGQNLLHRSWSINLTRSSVVGYNKRDGNDEVSRTTEKALPSREIKRLGGVSASLPRKATPPSLARPSRERHGSFVNHSRRVVRGLLLPGEKRDTREVSGRGTACEPKTEQPPTSRTLKGGYYVPEQPA